MEAVDHVTDVDHVTELARENVFKLYHLFCDHRHEDQWTKEAIPLSEVRVLVPTVDCDIRMFMDDLYSRCAFMGGV